jgi:hypothetical protein
MVLRKGNPFFQVKYTDLDAKYEKNSFKNQDDKGYYALQKQQVRKVVQVETLNTKNINQLMVGE